MALKVKYTDEHGVVHINMAPSPTDEHIRDPQFDAINTRFTALDLFGDKYTDTHRDAKEIAFDRDTKGVVYDRDTKRVVLERQSNKEVVLDREVDDVWGEGGEGGERSLFRSRYNSIEEELANTPYAFTARTVPAHKHLDLTLDRSPSKDIEDDRFFRKLSVEYEDTPAFSVKHLIHAQDRYFDLSTRTGDTGDTRHAFTVINTDHTVTTPVPAVKVVPISKRSKERSFAIVAEAPPASRPASPRSLPPHTTHTRISPFKGRGFREETSRHNTPKTSAANSPTRRRTSSLSSVERMATAALPPPPPLVLPPRDFVRENIQEVHGISEINREKNQAEAERKKIEEEEAIFKEMGFSEKEAKIEAIKSVTASRNNSRSNSPGKMHIAIRSRSNSPSVDRIIINKNDGLPKPHKSRVRTVRSMPQSKDGSPKHSKIPQRQASGSPKPNKLENGLQRNGRYMSNSTSSLHETIRIGSQVHDKRGSKSVQHLSIGPAHIKGKPPISPGKGPPPANKAINAKRLSPIVGTPNKSPTEDPKPKTGVMKTATSKTATNKAATTKTTTNKTTVTKPGTTKPATTKAKDTKQASKVASRDPSPDKRKTTQKVVSKPPKPISRTNSTKSISGANKTEPKKPISRSESIKSLSRTSSTKTLNGKPLKKSDSKKSLTNSNSSLNEIESHNKENKKQNSMTDSATDPEEIVTHDIETQYSDKSNPKGDLVIMTKKNIVSMTTAAITSQPLEVVAAVTNKLPVALEKARERAIFERNSSRESLNGEKKNDDKKKSKGTDESVKLKPLQPPYNDPQLERVKQKIDDILKTPEISRENILNQSAKKENKLKNIMGKSKAASAFSDTKDSDKDKKEDTEVKVEISKTNEIAEIRSEASKIVDSILTPVEEPKIEAKKEEIKKEIEPIVMVVNEKKKLEHNIEKTETKSEKHETKPEVKTSESKKSEQKVSETKHDMKHSEPEVSVKVNETLVKGEPEVEVQSSNVSSPGVNNKMADGSSDLSHSNGGFPQSTSTTPKPPARSRKEQREKERQMEQNSQQADNTQQNKQNICTRLMGKCRAKCCACCVSGEGEGEGEARHQGEGERKQGVMSKFSCCKKSQVEDNVQREVERAAGKGSTVEYEDETKSKRKLRDVLCGWGRWGRGRRVGDAGEPPRRVQDVSDTHLVTDAGCCGNKRPRRDSILSDRPNTNCCTRMCVWVRGMCRRQQQPASRRASMFSKNKSLSPTIPPEDTRRKLDPSLVEHTSMIRAAIPILPAPLAYFCLLCNILVPGLGSILSGMFCLCFGIPRFGVYDQARHRIGSFVTNLLVGCLQLFTVLFCLVGWGWSVWWGVIMVRISRKYRKLKAEEAAAGEEEPAPPPLTANNHTRA